MQLTWQKRDALAEIDDAIEALFAAANLLEPKLAEQAARAAMQAIALRTEVVK